MRGKWPRFEVNTEIHNSFENFELRLLELFQKEFKRLSQEENITKTAQTYVTIFSDLPLPFTSSELCDILQASAVNIIKGDSGNSSLPAVELGNGSRLQILVEQSKQHVCPRCWKANSAEEDELCDRCEEVVSELTP